MPISKYVRYEFHENSHRGAATEPYASLTVIIPTLNEEKSIGSVIASLQRGYPGVKIIVSDDGSSDHTRDKVAALRNGNRNVVFLDRSHERDHGLAASVLDAAIHAKTDRLIVMDGDMQHPPAKVGPLFRALDSAQIAVCVRTHVKDWGIHRKIISKGMAGIAYAVFKTRHRPTTHDMMSGFFAIRTRDLQRIVRSHRKGFVQHGYKVLLDILRMSPAGTRIAEIPYSTFHRRKNGMSKLGGRHVVNTLVSTFR